MSARRRVLLAVVLIAPLIGSAALLASRSDRAPADGEGDRLPPGASQVATPRAEVRGRAVRAIRRGDRRRRAQDARHEDPHGEPGPPPATAALYERVRARAEPVARRFFAAFSSYEQGDRRSGIARALHATATAAFARELLAAPPRAVAGAASAPATLGRVEFVPGRGRGGRLVAAEIVGVTRRGGREEPLSIRLRAERAGWRVSGLGR